MNALSVQLLGSWGAGLGDAKINFIDRYGTLRPGVQSTWSALARKRAWEKHGHEAMTSIHCRLRFDIILQDIWPRFNCLKN